jgi:hypothetical protein
VNAESLRTEYKRIAADGRSSWLSNVLLGVASALFVVLLVAEIWSRVSAK